MTLHPLSPENTSSENNTSLTVTVAEAAELLKVSRVTIYRLIERGIIRPIPFIRHKRISRNQLVQFVNQSGG